MEQDVKTGIYTYKEKEVTFNYYTNLSATDKVKFVNSVTDVIIGDNYNSIIKDLIFDFEIINTFTDIDLAEKYESSNYIDSIENFINETLVVDIVKANSNGLLIDELKQAVDDNIEFKTGIHRSQLTSTLSNLLRSIENKIVNIDTQEIIEIARKINGISNELTPDKILDAYAKTDIFKNRILDIETDKKM